MVGSPAVEFAVGSALASGGSAPVVSNKGLRLNATFYSAVCPIGSERGSDIDREFRAHDHQ